MKKRSGFTLLEIIIAMGISIVILFVIAQFVDLVARLQVSLKPMLQGNQDITYVLNTMTMELRSATESESGAYPVESASTSSMVFYTDADRDGRIERVRYSFASSTLWKGTTAPTGTPAIYPTSSELVTAALSGIASGSGLSFYDSNYTGSQAPMSGSIDPTVVRVVQVKINVKNASSSGSYDSTVMLRNLKSN